MAANINLLVGSLLSAARRLADDEALADALEDELERKVTDAERRGLSRLVEVLDALLATDDGDDAALDEDEVEPATPEELRAALVGAAVSWQSNELVGHVLTSVATYRGIHVRRRVDKRTRVADYAVRGDEVAPWQPFELVEGQPMREVVELVDVSDREPTDEELVELVRGACVDWTALGVRDGVKWHRFERRGVNVTRAVGPFGTRYEVRRGDASPYPLVVDVDEDETRRIEHGDAS